MPNKLHPAPLTDVDLKNLKVAGKKLEAEGHDVRRNGDISFTKVIRILLQQKASEKPNATNPH